MTDELTSEILAQQLRETQDLLDSTKALLARPVTVEVKMPPPAEQKTLEKIGQYLPQLTHIATNLSHVASAVQMSNSKSDDLNKTLKRIADALEKESP